MEELEEEEEEEEEEEQCGHNILHHAIDSLRESADTYIALNRCCCCCCCPRRVMDGVSGR